ncbi:hypothetical protein [Halopiger thermotolerans]
MALSDSHIGIHPDEGVVQKRSELDVEDWVKVAQRESKIIKVGSRYGNHYIDCRDSDDFLAVFSGPHGPENAPATIDEDNIKRLLTASNEIEIVDLSESPYARIEIQTNPGV